LTDVAENDLVRFIGGVPIIYPNFEESGLLSLVCANRRRLSGETSAPLLQFLEPEKARNVFKGNRLDLQALPESGALTGEQIGALDQSIAGILTTRPDWRRYFSIPIAFERWVGGKTGVSSPLEPQKILLGDSAFRSPEALTEAIVHEISHVWLGFLFEIADAQVVNASRVYTLPSGTRNKSARGVLFAAHFSAIACSFWLSDRIKRDSQIDQRIDYLRTYCAGCLSLLRDAPELTHVGCAVRDEIVEFNKSLG
jgi:hypothetical protein